MDFPVLPSLQTWIGLIVPERVAFFWGPTLANGLVILFLAATIPLLAIHYVGTRMTVWVLIGMGVIALPIYYTGKAVNTWWSYLTEEDHQEWRKANLALKDSKPNVSAEEYDVRQRMVRAITHAGGIYANFYDDSNPQINAYAEIPGAFRERDKSLFEIEDQYQKKEITFWEYRREIDKLNAADGPVKTIGFGYIPAKTKTVAGYAIFSISTLLLIVGNGWLTPGNYFLVRQARWRKQRIELEEKLKGLNQVQTVNYLQKKGSYSGPYRLAWPYLYARDVKLVLADSEWDPARKNHLILVTGVVLFFFHADERIPSSQRRSIFAER